MCRAETGETDLVEDAEFLSRLSGDLFSSGLHVSIYGFFNSCSTEEKNTITRFQYFRLLTLKCLCCCFLLTQCVCGSQGAGSGVLVGLTVAGGQRFSHRCSGAIRGVSGPAQGELQGGTLRETLKGRQTLQEGSKQSKIIHLWSLVFTVPQ